MKLLVVEDEIQLADALSEILKRNMYSVDTVYDGIAGLDNALTGVYDCILLDIMLPGMDGIEVLRRLRSEKVSTPVLLLTARSEVDDKINGLDCGADDYLTKPFVTGELLARVRALTRRKGEIIDENKVEFNGLELHKNTCSISYGGSDVKLRSKSRPHAVSAIRLNDRRCRLVQKTTAKVFRHHNIDTPRNIHRCTRLYKHYHGHCYGASDQSRS